MSHHPGSRVSSLGPGDSASQLSKFDFEMACKRLLDCVEPSSKRPEFLEEKVLWYYYDCLNDKFPGNIVSASNPCRPKMQLAVRRWDGELISTPEYNNIQRSAHIHAEGLIRLARSHPSIIASSTDAFKLLAKSDIKKWFNAQYSQAILELEKDQRLLRLCAGHWKADAVLGQAITQLNYAESKRTRARSNTSSSKHSLMPDPSDPLPAPISQVVVSLNAAKRALEMSPGPKSPSASHIQKCSKDQATVSGQKTMVPDVPSNRKSFFPQHGSSNH
jgi:hypothetical protein